MSLQQLLTMSQTTLVVLQLLLLVQPEPFFLPPPSLVAAFRAGARAPVAQLLSFAPRPVFVSPFAPLGAS